jgi:hypothetical protein
MDVRFQAPEVRAIAGQNRSCHMGRKLKSFIPFASRIGTVARVFLIAASVLAYVPAVAQEYQGPNVYGALLDYNVIHLKMIELCAGHYPGTEQPLKRAITEWDTKNRSALRELRALLREQAGSNAPRLEQTTSEMTTFMTTAMQRETESNLSSMCSGAYAMQLASPDMDYVAFLEKAKAAWVKQKPATKVLPPVVEIDVQQAGDHYWPPNPKP